MKTKIKICHVVNRLDIGGMENGVVNICNNLDRSRFIPTICCLNGKGLMSERLKNDVDCYCLGIERFPFIKRFFLTFTFFCRYRFDIVHTHGWGGGALYAIVAAKFAGVKFVINGEHGSFFLGKRQVLLQAFLFRFCNKILSVSDALKKRIITNLHVKAPKIIVIRNGVDVEKFCGQYNVLELKKSICGDPVNFSKYFFICCVGSLKPLKNQRLLIEAISKIKDDRVRLLLVGEGPDKQFLLDLVNSVGLKGRVHFLGARDDLHLIYSISNIFVLSSFPGHEGLSNVILEAMASGLPVITTASIGSDEIIIDGVNGFILQSAEPSTLSEKIIILMNNDSLRNEIGRKAKDYIREKFSFSRMLSEYENLYSSFN